MKLIGKRKAQTVESAMLAFDRLPVAKTKRLEAVLIPAPVFFKALRKSSSSGRSYPLSRTRKPNAHTLAIPVKGPELIPSMRSWEKQNLSTFTNVCHTPATSCSHKMVFRLQVSSQSVAETNAKTSDERRRR